MITLRDAIQVTKSCAEEIVLFCGDTPVEGFNWRNDICMEAYGDFVVGDIQAVGEQKFEISLAVRPIRANSVDAHLQK